MRRENQPPQQGTIIDCVYCQVIHPEFDTSNCQYCDGKGEYFLPARMMDRYTQNHELLDMLEDYFADMHKNKTTTAMDADRLRAVIEKLHLYNFDIIEALIARYHAMEQGNR